MSQEKVNPRLIKSNIDHLQKIVKRPAVTEKILSRPPFRFIFDLTTMIIKTTGYLRGLYTEDEFSWDMVSANKDTKMAFLDKLIDVIGLINSKPIDCKSAKIVAGVEVEKTNKLLLELAKCVEDKKPFVEAVEKVRKGFKPEAGSSSTSGSGIANVNSKTLTKSSLNKKAPPVKQATVTTKATTKTSSEPGTSKASKTGSGKPSSGRMAKVVDVPQKSQPTTATTMVVDDLDMATNDDDDVLEENGINDVSSVRRPSTTTKSLESYRNENEPPPPQQPEAEAPDDILVVDNLVHHEDTTNNPTMMKNLINEELSLVSSSSSSSPLPAAIPSGDNFAKVEYDQRPEPTVSAPSIDKKFNQDPADTTTKEDHHPNNLVTSNEIRTNDNDGDYSAGVGAPPPPPPPPQPSTPAASTANDIVNKRLKSSSVTRGGGGGGGGRSARPKSSRPAPPRVMTASRSRLNQLMENSGGNSAAAATNGVGAGGGSSGASAASNVWIPEAVDDDNDEFLISSQKLQDSFLSMDGGGPNRGGEASKADSEQTTTATTSKGHLVQQLMATKSELEGQIKANHQSINGDQLESKPNNVIDDTNQLRNQIQALCQSIGTLTKAMGYLHEDVGPMLDERRKWQTECQTNQEQIERIRADMAKDMEPLRKELSMIERQVEDYQERIHSTKSNIYRNEQIISKLIDSV